MGINSEKKKSLDSTKISLASLWNTYTGDWWGTSVQERLMMRIWGSTMFELESKSWTFRVIRPWAEEIWRHAAFKERRENKKRIGRSILKCMEKKEWWQNKLKRVFFFFFNVQSCQVQLRTNHQKACFEFKKHFPGNLKSVVSLECWKQKSDCRALGNGWKEEVEITLPCG